MNLKKIGKVLTRKSVGTGPSSYEKRIYRAAVSQMLRNTALNYLGRGEFFKVYFLHKHAIKYHLMTNARAHKIAERKQRKSHVMLPAFIILILTSDAWVQSHATSTTHIT